MDPIAKLKDGYRSFRNGMFQERRETYETLVDEGQHPKICLIACADSRVDPAMMLGADPGDIFMVRNIAALVPPYENKGEFHGTSAALQFAVENLQVDHLVVLGHAHCGGIRSLFSGSAENHSENDFVSSWMTLARSAYLEVQKEMPDAPEDERARACEQKAVLLSLENLTTFPFIKERLNGKHLQLHGWHIDIRSGVLATSDPSSRAFSEVS